DSAFPVDEECGRQRIDTAVQIGGRVIALLDPVVDRQLRDERLDDGPSLLVHGYSHDGEAMVFIVAFEFDEPGNLDLAWTAPSGPEIEQHHFAFVIGQT